MPGSMLDSGTAPTGRAGAIMNLAVLVINHENDSVVPDILSWHCQAEPAEESIRPCAIAVSAANDNGDFQHNMSSVELVLDTYF